MKVWNIKQKITKKQMKHTSGWSLDGTYSFSENVCTGPICSGNASSSRWFPLWWNNANLTRLISENAQVTNQIILKNYIYKLSPLISGFSHCVKGFLSTTECVSQWKRIMEWDSENSEDKKYTDHSLWRKCH